VNFVSKFINPTIDSFYSAGPRGSRGPRKDKAAGEGGDSAAPAEAAKA
jgi:hypothetical protein